MMFTIQTRSFEACLCIGSWYDLKNDVVHKNKMNIRFGRHFWSSKDGYKNFSVMAKTQNS